jgi:predicted nucleic acid-binding protein
MTATRGLLDTSVLIDHGDIAAGDLPHESYVHAIVLAELAAGPSATANKSECRLADYMITATAAANGLPLYTDFAIAKGLMEIIALPSRH